MKSIILALFSSVLMMISISSFADKVVITGAPVVLEERGDVYYVPETYTGTTSYHYVTVGGTNKVCYAEKQPSLASVDMVLINVNVGGKQVQWTCYNYDETYFEVTP